MFVSFGMAEAYGGQCILRFDDTNPEAEKKEYIDHIQEIVAWMGWKPAQVALLLCIATSSCHHNAWKLQRVGLVTSGNHSKKGWTPAGLISA